MKNNILAGMIALGFSAVILALPASAACFNGKGCGEPALAGVQKASYQPPHGATPRHRRTGTVSVATTATQDRVIAMITEMAPRYKVPAWFALRIAKVESGFNPSVRGTHGEYGVFQLKCQTARGIGYHGACSGLLDARTNVSFGLKHLSLAIASSGGNLRLAASKHNGGLGTRHLVKRYVAQVF
jgi:soluble lytic murein transglycosylase-like protein